MQFPELSEGWAWNITRPVVRCTNGNCCTPEGDGHLKVRVELLLHGDVRERGTIDVEFYGEAAAVELARHMVGRVHDKQLAYVTGIDPDKS